MTKNTSLDLAAIASRFGWRKSGSRWTGACPKCGGSSRTDRFSFWEAGMFKCYGCEFKGDDITWLRDIESMSCADAHEAAGRPCRSTTCPHRGTCRLGDGSGTIPARRPRSARTPDQSSPRHLPAAQVQPPAALAWTSWADGLQQSSAARLAGKADVLAWLAGRGISQAAATHYGLGWREHDQRVDRAGLGLSPTDANGKPTLWVPGGLVIPIFDEAGVVHRLRIRRTDEARSRFLPDLKYVWLQGSGTAPMLLRRPGARGLVVVEAELDAIAVAAAHPGVDVVALGTVAAGLGDELHRICAAIPVILVALDADPARDGADGAGPRAVSNWCHTFPQARFWPVPAGKDPGEYAAQGGDLAAWIEAGLPRRLEKTTPAQDRPSSLDDSQRGERDDRISIENEGCYAATLADGRTMHITADQGEWSTLAAEGAIVFSHNELARVQEATSSLPGPERERVALAVVDIKDVFGAAYVRAGRKITTTKEGTSWE